jgi:hypothetical protein
MKQMPADVLAQKILATLIRYGFVPHGRPRAVVEGAVAAAIEAALPAPAVQETYADNAQGELSFSVPRISVRCSPLVRARSLEKRSAPNLDRKKPVPDERLNEASVTCAHIMLIGGYPSMRYDDALNAVRRVVVEAVSLLGYTTASDCSAVAWPTVKHWSVLARDDGATDEELLAAAKWWGEHPGFLRRGSREVQPQLLLAAS